MASAFITLTQGTTSLILSLTGCFCHPQLFCCFWITLSTSHRKVFLPQHHCFCREWWDVLGRERQISECFNKETTVEVFHDFLLSPCLNLSSLISFFPFRGRIVWGSVRRKKEKILRKKALWKEQKALLIQGQQGWKQGKIIAPQDHGWKYQCLHY